MEVLLVDDDPSCLKLIEMIIGQQGHNPICASSAAQALETLKDRPIEVVVSDWMMPDTDGLELCREIRRLEAGTPRVYHYFIVATCAEDSSDNKRLAMAAGVDDFLQKPLDLLELEIRLHVASRILQYQRHVTQLHDRILTICQFSKQVQVDDGHWVTFEKYFQDLLGVRFTRGMCPEQARLLQRKPRPYKPAIASAGS